MYKSIFRGTVSVFLWSQSSTRFRTCFRSAFLNQWMGHTRRRTGRYFTGRGGGKNLPWKLQFGLKINKYFLSFRIFEQLALALKTEFALKFFKTRRRPPYPEPPARTSMVIPHWWALVQFSSWPS